MIRVISAIGSITVKIVEHPSTTIWDIVSLNTNFVSVQNRIWGQYY